METATPMLRQYREIKAKHKDCILFFRLGDFYEMFYEDAKTGARVLDLVLTARGKDPQTKVPMCGLPFHAAENYIGKLIKAGHKVAICEQLENPAEVKGQGIVKRDVTRVITSGTYIDDSTVLPRYILCLSLDESSQMLGLSFCDQNSGSLQTCQIPLNTARLLEILGKLPAYECVFPESQKDAVTKIFNHPFLKNQHITLSPFEDWCFNKDIARKALLDHFQTANLHGFGVEDKPLCISASAALLEYLKQMNQTPLKHVDRISLYHDEEFCYISPAAVRGLELDSLIKTVDATQTAMGKRLLRLWLFHPLKHPEPIIERQVAIKLLIDSPKIQAELRNIFQRIPDLEKNIARLSCGYTHAKDLLAVRNCLNEIPKIREVLTPLRERNVLFDCDDIIALREILTAAVAEDIPLSNPEGKIVAKGYNKELDELKSIQETGRQWLKKLQEQEIKRTGINSLKIGFNKVFGYYIEVTKTHASKVPSDFIRKQTLVNGERFITPELKEYEEKILTAQDKILKIENEIVVQLQQAILEKSLELHNFCQAVATIDTLLSLSFLAQSKGYRLPKIDDSTTLHITEGRHPVVEKNISEGFIANDTLLDCEENHLMILTGPNMAGKSTYIRQTALLTIMAQTGSYIPCAQAHIGIVDKIFTRIGAHDDISRGQSTFMVEMNETADILNNLTPKSLVILDEIGRGTSTYDGLSLAWALAEHLHKTRVRAMFATHFHEITSLADEREGIKNYNVAVKEWKDEIIFLHKIVPGSTDDSYGIYVAKLAGIPIEVISRAKSILTSLELKKNVKRSLTNQASSETQLNLFADTPDPKLQEMKEIISMLDINNLTPMEALVKLKELKEKMR